MTRKLIGLISATLLASCTVGPNYQPEPFAPQAAFSNSAAMLQAKDAQHLLPSAEGAWWNVFGDPMLTSLINDAVSHNKDLEAARANVRMARAMHGAKSAQSLPAIGASGSFERRRSSENGPIDIGALNNLGIAEAETNLIQTGFDAGWEIDIFGGTRRGVEAARANAGAAQEDRRALTISIIAEVARNYSELRGAQRRLALVDQKIAIRRKILGVIQAKLNAGLVSEREHARAQMLMSGVQAERSPVQADIRASMHRIAVLTGQAPVDLITFLLKTSVALNIPHLVPTGLPSDLLLRRPDIRSAERRLAASSANIGVAKAEFLPKFSLTGSIGLQSVSFTDMFSSASGAWSIGPSLRLPIFQGGRLRENLNRAQAQNDQANARFQQSVLLALEDVETSLVRYAQSQLRQGEIAQSLSANSRSVDLARAHQKQGLSSLLDLLQAEHSLILNEEQYVLSNTQTLLHTIALYKALGGGWTVFERPDKVLSV